MWGVATGTLFVCKKKKKRKVVRKQRKMFILLHAFLKKIKLVLKRTAVNVLEDIRQLME